jgi:hypothetical protein
MPSDGEGESSRNSPVRLIAESSQLDSEDEEANREPTRLEQVIEDIAFFVFGTAKNVYRWGIRQLIVRVKFAAVIAIIMDILPKIA